MEGTFRKPSCWLIVSPTYANEFGNEVVARLAGINGSIPGLFQDTTTGRSLLPLALRSPLVNIYHMFCSARIVHLVSVFNLQDSPITTRVWALLKYTLGRKREEEEEEL